MQYDPSALRRKGDRVLSEREPFRDGHHPGPVLPQIRKHPRKHRHGEHHHRLGEGCFEPPRAGGLYAHRGPQDQKDPQGGPGHPLEAFSADEPPLFLQVPGGAQKRRPGGDPVFWRHHGHHQGHRADQQKLQRHVPAGAGRKSHVPGGRQDAGRHAFVPRLRPGRMRAHHAGRGRALHPDPALYGQELRQTDREVPLQLHRGGAHPVRGASAPAFHGRGGPEQPEGRVLRRRQPVHRAQKEVRQIPFRP